MIDYAAVDVRDGGVFSRRCGDCYFSVPDGVAEADYVYPQATRLSERLLAYRRDSDITRTREDRFTVAELGFGTGLNCALTLQHWRQLWGSGPPAFPLRYLAIEAWPLHPKDLLRAVRIAAPAQSALSELWLSLARGLGGAYAGWCPGQPLQLQPLPGVTLELHIGDAHAILPCLSEQADIWYLDGFAPGADPGLWSDDIYAGITRCSRRGASCSSFTAVGHVRRGLLRQGWAMQRIPGWGRKRHMLAGTLPEATRQPETI